MEPTVAEVVARSTRERAVKDAGQDLSELRRRAVEAGRERSRKIIKVTTINTQTGVLRHNPAGRVLRDWYVHVYLNTLRKNLGQPAEPIDAQQIEDTAALLHRVRPGSEALRALQATGVTRNLAIDDAAQAAAGIVAHLRGAGAQRAIRHAGDDRFDGDQLLIHVTRHWYQRCYDDHVETVTGSQQPLTGVTDAEEQQVAQTLATRQVRRLIGRDGIPLVTVHGTLMNDVDRRLAAGETGIVPASLETQRHDDVFATLERRIRRAWLNLPPDGREQWLRLAGAGYRGNDLRWPNLTAEQQLSIARHYLSTNRRDLLDEAFDRATIRAAPEVAARRMFNHSVSLEVGAAHPAGEAYVPPTRQVETQGESQLRLRHGPSRT